MLAAQHVATRAKAGSNRALRHKTEEPHENTHKQSHTHTYTPLTITRLPHRVVGGLPVAPTRNGYARVGSFAQSQSQDALLSYQFIIHHKPMSNPPEGIEDTSRRFFNLAAL